MKEIIAITNDKGGVGKTTTAQNLATGLLLKGFKVLVIDADSQRYASFSNGWDSDHEKAGQRTLFHAMSTPSSLPVYRSEKGLFYTPSSEQMAKIDSFLNMQMSPNTVLKQVFGMPLDKHFDDESIQTIQDFDYVIIDCPPSLGSITINVLAASTGVIVPVQLEAYSVRGLGNINAKFVDVKAMLNPDLQMRGYLLVMTDQRLETTKVYAEQLGEIYDDLIFNTSIRRNTTIAKSQEMDSDIFSYDESCNGAKDYMAFVEEFLATSKL